MGWAGQQEEVAAPGPVVRKVFSAFSASSASPTSHEVLLGWCLNVVFVGGESTATLLQPTEQMGSQWCCWVCSAPQVRPSLHGLTEEVPHLGTALDQRV